MLYLQKLGDSRSCEKQGGKQSTVLGTVDVKDAFLMMDQEKRPMVVSLCNKLYRVKCNLPGQRLAKKSQCCVMVHVDDVMFCGDRKYWENAFFGEAHTALRHQPFTAARH